MTRALKRWIRRRFPRPSPPVVLEDVQTSVPVGGEVERPWVFEDPDVSRKNANDIRCVSWILRNITDPEAIDATIRFAGTIRWFEDGINPEPPYDVIVSTFKSCFDSSDKVYPGSMDRAYYSARAVLQIHVFAMCRPQEFVHMFPLPHISHNAGDPGQDLATVLSLCRFLQDGYIWDLYHNGLSQTVCPTHLRWTSNLLLQFAWTNRSTGSTYYLDINPIQLKCESWDEFLPAIVPNCLLIWCIILGGHIDENVLRIEDKSCVMFYILPLEMHTPSCLVFVWIRFYLDSPARS